MTLNVGRYLYTCTIKKNLKTCNNKNEIILSIQLYYNLLIRRTTY